MGRWVTDCHLWGPIGETGTNHDRQEGAVCLEGYVFIWEIPKSFLTQKSMSTRGWIKNATVLLIKRTLYMYVETDKRQMINGILGFCNKLPVSLHLNQNAYYG